MRRIDEYKVTSNRKVYNQLRKEHLEMQRDIVCSWCKYNRGENSKWKYYGSISSYRRNSQDMMRYPSWKLVSKNRKQWMKKPKHYEEVEKQYRYGTGSYTIIEFKRNKRE